MPPLAFEPRQEVYVSLELNWRQLSQKSRRDAPLYHNCLQWISPYQSYPEGIFELLNEINGVIQA